MADKEVSLSPADQVVYEAFLADRKVGGNNSPEILAGLSDEGFAFLRSAPPP